MSKIPCILNSCPHVKHDRCGLLGECGAGYALRKASEPGGYEVINFENPTLKSLLASKLVQEVTWNGRCVTVVATQTRAVA